MPRTKQPNDYIKPVKAGRKHIFDHSFIPLAVSIVKETGASVRKVANILGLNAKVFERWLREGNAFNQGAVDTTGMSEEMLDRMRGLSLLSSELKVARDTYNTGRVERSLIDRACGYEYHETKVTQITLTKGTGRGKTPIKIPANKTTVTSKRVQPSDVAIIFYLCNRHPDRWTNVQKIVSENKNINENKNEFDLDKLGRKELEELKEILGEAKRDGTPLSIAG